MRLINIFLVFSAFLLTSCSIESKKAFVEPKTVYTDPNNESEVNTREQQQLAAALLNDFPDIPVPVGYRVDLTQSTSFYSSNYSAGKIVLIGSSPSGALFNFFHEQMSANGWTLVNKMQSEISVLNFAKPGKFVSVQIQLNGKITILVSPE